MMNLSQCLRAYAVGDEDVTDGSVENYDFDWGEPVESAQSRTPCGGSGTGRCTRQCQPSCGGCETEPEPEPEPDPVEDPPACPCGRRTAAERCTYPIIDL